MKSKPVAGWLCCVLSAAVLTAGNTGAEESNALKESRAEALQHPDDLNTQKQHAELCLKEHAEAEAVIAARTAKTLTTNDTEVARLYVTALARNGRYQEAMDEASADKPWLTDKSIEKIAESASLAVQADDKLKEVADTASRADYLEVAGLLEKALSLDSDNLAIGLTLGWVYIDKLHEPKSAYPHLEAAAKYHPEDLNARKLFALACSQTGHLGKAAEEFRAASLLRPGDPWIQANLGRTLARMGHYSEAEKIYADVLQNDPKNVDALLGMAEIQAWRGETAKPLVTLDALISENPKNVEALNLRGDVHRWNWDLTEAKQDYQKVLEIDYGNTAARNGLNQARQMGAVGLNASTYGFRDNSDFNRESVGGGLRLPLADKVYLLVHGTAWRFTQENFTNLNRFDGQGGLEIDWCRWLQTTVNGDVFDYEHREAFGGVDGSVKLSLTSACDIYTTLTYNQPFVSSIATVTRELRDNSIGNGVDWRWGRRWSFQNSLQLARISDDNEWIDEKPQLSYRLFGATYLRAEYEYYSYKRFDPDYWTPSHRNSAGPVLDTSIPLGKCLHLVASGSAPYIFNESKLGYQAQVGPAFDFSERVQLSGSYYYSSMPGDQGAWSGTGWQAALDIRF